MVRNAQKKQKSKSKLVESQKSKVDSLWTLRLDDIKTLRRKKEKT